MPSQQRSVVRRAWVATGLVLLCLVPVDPPRAEAQATTGSWQLGPNLPFFPIHDHVLPDGKVMMWPGDQGINGDDPRTWDPATGSRHHAPQGRLRHLLQRPQLPAGRPAVRRRRAHQQRGRPGQRVDLQPGGQLLAEPAAHEPGPLVPHHDRPVQRRRARGQRQRRRHRRQQPGSPGLAGRHRHVAQPEQRATSSSPSTRTCSWHPTGACSTPGRASPRGCSTRRAPVPGPWSGNHRFNASRDYGSAVMYEPGKILLAGGGDPPRRPPR